VRNFILIILFAMPALLKAQEQQETVSDASMQEFSRSLGTEFNRLKTAEERKDKKAFARSLGNIGRIYLNIAKNPPDDIRESNLIATDKKANLNKSIEYSDKAIKAGEDIGDVEQMRTAYKNLYAAQKMSGKLKDAMSTYAKMVSLKETKELERKRLEYEYSKREDSIRQQKMMAEEHLKEQAQQLSQKQQELQRTNQTLSATEKEKEDTRLALHKTQTDLLVEKSNSEEKEKELTVAEQEKALQAVNMQLQQSKLQLQQNELQLQQSDLLNKDKVIEQRRKERNFYILGIIGLLAVSLLAYRSVRVQKRYNLALLKEKKRSEDLLLNILPVEVAAELMEKGFADAKHFDDVTVLFTDFVSFTSIAETMSPQQLVSELHVCFKAFDGILSKYHIEKIKTVGDAYMAVSGLPAPNANHAADIVSAAIEIRDFMLRRKVEMGNGTFSIRVGINSGNVVAGIVGVRKFSYDIWGDTVNIAARMEQNSEEGKINISESTYQLVKDKYGCIYRGKIEAKNKGHIDMYYLV